MKAIMISIQPQWLDKILNGEKTIEIRKTTPSCELPCKVYIYCTKSKPTLQYFYNWQNYKPVSEHSTWASGRTLNIGEYGNGKVVAEFTFNEFEDFSKWEYDFGALVRHLDLWAGTKGNYPFLIDYLKGQKKGYAWHIDNLKIYDKPKELSEFGKDLDCDNYPCNKNKYCEHYYYDWSEGCGACGIDFDGEHCIYKTLKRPPQSWCKVEELQDNK